MNAIFMTMSGERAIFNAYDGDTREKLNSRLNFLPSVFKIDQLEERGDELNQTEFIFSTWGMPAISEEQIQRIFPNLKAVFYAAGSVQGFARPFLNCGVSVFSAYAANAVPVAEYTLAQIILAGKGFFQSSRLYKQAGRKSAYDFSASMPGNYGAIVGIIGAGAIGTMVIERLKGYNLPVIVFDPFLPDEKAIDLGVRKVSLEELFTQSQIISNHLANNAQTRGMLNYDLFRLTKNNMTFINTGRGAQVVEADLARALREEPSRTAILDVTDPEPVKAGNPFLEMDNVILTPHIAGSMKSEVARMGSYMYEEFVSFSEDRQTRYGVTLKMLETMA